MLVVDASCLYGALIGTPAGEAIRARMELDAVHVAPHVVDVEVLGVIRKEHQLGRLDATAAGQAVEDLASWPARRFGHRALLARAWELRANVRGCDAMYVALAEIFDAVLLTTDGRLAGAPGPTCVIEVIPSGT